MGEREAFLVLADGSVYRGYAFGGEGEAHGEVVFNTSMAGYQEMLTDPSYAGQVLVPTYPLQGNYGVNAQDVESARVQVRGFVVRDWCPTPSHRLSEGTLDGYLRAAGVPGLYGVDTRALTRRLRGSGVMMGAIVSQGTPEEALVRLEAAPSYGSLDFVREVSTAQPYGWPPGGEEAPGRGPRIVVLDEGLKYNILRLLGQRGCQVLAVPGTISLEQLLALGPQGVVLSPGPGDPALLRYIVETTRGLLGRVPMLGICLGHQLVAQALGGATYKLKFGHRGGNHPVKDLGTGRVSITAQNHGYAVDADSLPAGLEVSHINLNDGTVEGLRHRALPLLTIQYHSEASPGPRDNEQVFDQFLKLVQNYASV
ncbi:MAG: glutamine-hydrolyzing carbamoyl-phosphate synthase small subunit [Chloroflexi bacterium]|nr:glutamine-hydrolyzing carbamoyl-phosphate synthase small subunit [Chloroflexota bacterium]